jgi:hypothetical protein
MRRVLVLAALPLLTSCGGTQPLSGGPGGLQGKVMRGPITPTCTQGRSCSEPARGVTLRFSKDGSLVALVKTDDGGAYRVTLPPGRYFVTAVQPVRPQQVSVGRRAFRRVDFAIDTKIR